MKRTISTTMILIGVLVGSLGLPVIAAVHANPVVESSARVTIHPRDRIDRTFYTNETFPGATFVINVTAIDVVDLQNWQIALSWDPAVMEYVTVLLPSDNVFGGSGKSLITPPPDIGSGYVVWGCTYINDPYWTFNGTGTLCQVKLRLLPTPTPPPITFNLTLVGPYDDTFLLDSKAHNIPFTIEDGTFTLLALPDIAVIDIAPSKTIVAYNYSKSLRINVTILNQDYYLPNTFNLTIYADDSLLATTENVTLPSRNFTTLAFTWNITDLLKGNHTITAVTDPVPGETDLNDNIRNQTVVITIPGDVTSGVPEVTDGLVDMRDIGAICNQFGTAPSSSKWKSNYDINDDNVVNMRDIGIACNNFMKTDS